MSIFEKIKLFKKTAKPEEKSEEIAAQQEERREDLSPEREAYLEELIGKGKFLTEFNLQERSELFMKIWLDMDYSLSYKETLLKERKIWFAMKKEGIILQDIIKNKITPLNNLSEVYFLIGLYCDLGYEDRVEFLCQLLDRPKIWNHADGSCVSDILRFIRETGDPSVSEVVIRYINNILLPGYSRQDQLAHDLYDAARTLRAILGNDESEKILRTLAERYMTFKDWFEINKLIDDGQEFSDQIETEPVLDVFDEEKELARLIELEAQYNQWLENYSSPSPIEYADSYNDRYIQLKLSESSRFWEKDKAINFQGRFRAITENGVPLDRTNYLSALRGTIGTVGSGDSWNHNLNLLSGVVDEQLLATEVSEKLDQQEMFKVVSLGVSEVLCRAVLENKREEALAKLESLRQFIVQKKDITSVIFRKYLAKSLNEIENYIKNDSNFDFPELPKGAESFLMYHAWFNKTRELPDFRVLLAEKVRWLMANDLANNLQFIRFDITGLPIEGPSFDRFIDIVERYKNGLTLYKTVEQEDTPIYWEAIDKLEDSDAEKVVVFGRDGHFFFTALKACVFGVEDKEIKYVVVTRNMKDLESQERITRYLRQNGISLDFTFIDTGFRGTIPELVINYLASEQGVHLSQEEIDQKIALLSSSTDRTELSRKRRDPSAQQKAIYRIEDNRPQNIESPKKLEMDERGKLKPKGEINSMFDQLDCWIVEHASLRNFAPKLNPDKRIEYTRQDPLEGLTFVQDYYGESIGTHPMELWEDRNKKRFLIKGGPEHTLRADFVGQRFLKIAGLKVPETDLLMVGDQLKLKIEFLYDYKIHGLHIPVELQNDEHIQAAVLIDAFLGQYDRTPWNLMFSKDKYGTDVAFIDNGASLFSRAKGGA